MPPLAPHHRRVVDDALDAYLEWREQCSAVWDAYGWWSRSAPADNVPAHAAYQAALDREEAAANAYVSLLNRVAELLERTAQAPIGTEGKRQR